MSINPLVSIITPCYNGEKFIRKYVESLLSQTYNHMEVIFVNDGSDDKTEEVIFSYRNLLEENRIQFRYIYQRNKGAAAAIGEGLQKIQGDYLTWIDIDDWMLPECIQKKVEFLENNEECGLVRSNAAFFNEASDIPLYFAASKKDKRNKDVFLDLLLGKTYVWCGCYMIRVSCLYEMNPSLHIFPSKYGQNMQLEVPVSYKYPCGYIDESLYCILIRSDSHSRKKRSAEEEKKRIDGVNDIRMWCAKLVCPENEKLIHSITRLHLKELVAFAYSSQNTALLTESYKQLKKEHTVDIKTKLYYYRGKWKIYDRIFKVLYFPFRISKNIKCFLK